MGGALRETWQGILGETRLQKPLCKLLLKSRFLREKIRSRPNAAEVCQKAQGNSFAYLETHCFSRTNTFDLFADKVPVDGKHILDLGCGNAVLSCRYIDDGARWVVGCDRNYERWPLANAKKYVEYRGLGGQLPLVLGDGAALPFRSHSFDLVISNNVFDHIVQLPETLEECYRVLRPGGQMVVTFIPWYHPGGSHLRDFIYIPYANLLFSEKALLAVLHDLAVQNPQAPNLLRGGHPPPASLDEIGLVLSRVTLRQFRQMLKRTPFKIVYFHLTSFGCKTGNPLLKTLLDSLVYVPLVNEFFTSHIDCILEKPMASLGMNE